MGEDTQCTGTRQTADEYSANVKRRKKCTLVTLPVICKFFSLSGREFTSSAIPADILTTSGAAGSLNFQE